MSTWGGTKVRQFQNEKLVFRVLSRGYLRQVGR